MPLRLCSSCIKYCMVDHILGVDDIKKAPLLNQVINIYNNGLKLLKQYIIQNCEKHDDEESAVKPEPKECCLTHSQFYHDIFLNYRVSTEGVINKTTNVSFKYLVYYFKQNWVLFRNLLFKWYMNTLQSKEEKQENQCLCTGIKSASTTGSTGRKDSWQDCGTLPSLYCWFLSRYFRSCNYLLLLFFNNVKLRHWMELKPTAPQNKTMSC